MKILIRDSKYYRFLLIASLTLFVSGCGDNLFSSLEKTDTATDATIQLESGDPAKAITLILDKLGDAYSKVYEATNADSDLFQAQSDLNAAMLVLVDEGDIEDVPNLVSILASARAQKHGIDPFEIALKFAEAATTASEDTANADAGSSSTASAGPGNDVTRLFPILPEASAENLEGLDVAMTVLRSTGTYKTTSDDYKEALLLTASIALVTKTLDSDGDGEISALESVSLSDAAAKALLNQITAAVLAAAASSDLSADSETAKSTEQIQALQSQIDAEEGATQEEKLRNFIAKSEA